jgi:hypothetical protein
MKSFGDPGLGATMDGENLGFELYRGVVITLSAVIPTVALMQLLGFGTPASGIAGTLILPSLLALAIKLTPQVRGGRPAIAPGPPALERRTSPLWDRELDG